MKNLLNVTALITLIFFCSENTFAQNTTENNSSTIKIETPAESSSLLEVPTETKLIRGDGINP